MLRISRVSGIMLNRHAELMRKGQPRIHGRNTEEALKEEQAYEYQLSRNELKERTHREIKSMVQEKTQLNRQNGTNSHIVYTT